MDRVCFGGNWSICSCVGACEHVCFVCISLSGWEREFVRRQLQAISVWMRGCWVFGLCLSLKPLVSEIGRAVASCLRLTSSSASLRMFFARFRLSLSKQLSALASIAASDINPCGVRNLDLCDEKSCKYNFLPLYCCVLQDSSVWGQEAGFQRIWLSTDVQKTCWSSSTGLSLLVFVCSCQILLVYTEFCGILPNSK